MRKELTPPVLRGRIEGKVKQARAEILWAAGVSSQQKRGRLNAKRKGPQVARGIPSEKKGPNRGSARKQLPH